MDKTTILTLSLGLAVALASSACDDGSSSRATNPTPVLGADGGVPITSGVPVTSMLEELDARQIQQLCEWAMAVRGGTNRTEICDAEGNSVGTGTVPACVENLNFFSLRCEINVGEMEDCMRAMNRTLCAYHDDPACLPARACGTM